MDQMLRDVTATLASQDNPPYPFDNVLSTRQPILDEVFRLFDSQGAKVVWMTGNPGSGKTVLAQRLMRMLHPRNRLAAAFLFPQTGRLRRDHVLGTFHRQFIANIPGYQEQWDALQADSADSAEILLAPFAQLPRPEGENPKVIILDNLHQAALLLLKDLLETFTSSQSHYPFLVFVTSTKELVQQGPSLGLRNGAQIAMLDISEALEPLIHDVMVLNQSSHPLRAQLPPGWPPEGEWDVFIYRALQSPLYASIAAEFISNKHYRPDLRLAALVGTPFAYDYPNQPLRWFDRSILPLFTLIVADASNAIPSSSRYLAYLFCYLNDTSPDQRDALTGINFFGSVLGLSREDVSLWQARIHPLIVAEGDGQYDFPYQMSLLTPKAYLTNWDNVLGDARCDLAIACLSVISNGSRSSIIVCHLSLMCLLYSIHHRRHLPRLFLARNLPYSIPSHRFSDRS